MRLVCAFVLVAFLSLLASTFGGDRAEAGIVCGTFDGKFSCRSESKAGAQFGKNAIPGARIGTPDDSPEGVTGEQNPTDPAAGHGNTGQGTWEATPDATTTCQHGMTGTPPNCRCPKNSELLGGNCVHYTASACSSGLASDALPQACRGAEEKLSCTMRQDGSKDCCCLTYDKF
jgi:hypothetical protein